MAKPPSDVAADAAAQEARPGVPGESAPPSSGVTGLASWRVPADPRASDVGASLPSWADAASTASRLVVELSDVVDAPAAAAAVLRSLIPLVPRRAVAVRLGAATEADPAIASSRPLPKGEALAGALALSRAAHARGEPFGGAAGVFGGQDGYTVPLVLRAEVVGVVAVEPATADSTLFHEACAVALALGPVAPTLALAASNVERDVLRQLAFIVEQAPFPAAVVDRAFVIRAANALCADALGSTIDRLVGVPAGRLAEGSSTAKRVLARLKGGEVVSGIELEHAQPNRRVVWVAVPLVDGKGELAFAIAFGDDRSAVQILEEQILHAEKLATVGQLAAGIVHELNNPLTSISVYGDYLLQKAERSGGGDSADLERLRRIVDASARMLRFTRDLVSYARPSNEEPSECAVGGVIDQSIGFVEHVLTSANVRVIVDAAPELPPVRAVRGQLHQVFVNLLTNATQAIASAGRPSGAIRITAVRAESLVRVRIADDGPGISSEHLGRVFEPFFTTKEAGRGTGLGLSIVRNIVQLHGGTIHVESVHAEAGTGATGTTFVLALPIRREAQ